MTNVDIIKREANILLASLNKEDMKSTKPFMDIMVDFGNILDKYNLSKENLDIFFKYLNKYKLSNLLAPLTLNRDEFDDNGINIRYPDIFIKNNKMYNNNAFNCYVRASYSHTLKLQNDIVPFIISKNSKVYISKGGVITGEYFNTCVIRKKIINSGSFTIQSVVNIPVCEILDHDISIIAVDHREPKFKSLCDFYDVSIKIDKNIKQRKFNIRNYTKL